MKRYLRVIVATALVFTFFTASSAGASGIAPGSSADPFVSRSYVDDKYDSLLEEYEELLDTVGVTGFTMTDAQFEFIVAEVLKEIAKQEVDEPADSAYAPVSLYGGQVLTGGEGTEIILRSGTAYAVVSGANGISDITQGKDIVNNEQVRQNHLLIVPRSDGRGVRAQTECWFLIKGEYNISY